MSDVKNDNAPQLGSPTPAPQSTPDAAADIDREVEAALGGKSIEELMDAPGAGSVPGSAPSAAGNADDGDADGSAPDSGHGHATDLVRGRIIRLGTDDVFVEITGLGGKNQGVVPITQFERPPRLGSIMEFIVERVDEAEGLIHLSREGAVSRLSWEQLQKGATVEARVVGTNKGGLELEMAGGILAFMPASQIDIHHTDDMTQFVGQKLTACVQEISKKNRRVILSRRQYLEIERERQREKAWQTLEVGQMKDGVVRSLAEYGAFVDIGGVDGLLHISDMSYSRLAKPEEMLKVGQQVQVKVLKIDAEKKRISLGLKQVAPDPWEGIETRLKVNEQISARITRTQDFGAFAEVFPGVEGLIPASEVSWRRNVKVSDSVKAGDVLRVVVMAMEPAKRRLTLSLKQAGGNPWADVATKYARHALVEGTIQSIPEFGAFVELEPGVEGLVHISELSDKRVNAVTDVVKVGQKHTFRVLEVDEANRRIRLSLKAAKHDVVPDAPGTPGSAPAPGKPVAKKPKPANLKGGIQGAGLGIGLGQLKL